MRRENQNAPPNKGLLMFMFSVLLSLINIPPNILILN